MVGYVGGFGYGLQFSTAKGGESFNNTFYRCQRHSLYFAEGDNYTSVGDQFFEHKKNATTTTSRSALMVARSQNVNIIAPRFYDCWYGNLFIETDTAYGPCKGINIISPIFYDPQKAETLRVGSSSPSTEGLVYDVSIESPKILQLNVDENVQPLIINSCDGLKITDLYLKYSGYTGASGHRSLVFSASDGASYTDNVSINGKIIDDSTNGYGVQMAATLCTGTSTIDISGLDITANLAPIEYVTATPTNPNLNGQLYKNTAFGSSSIANATTAGKMKTTATVYYKFAETSRYKSATDNLWDLTGVSTGAAEYLKVVLCLDNGGAAQIVTGTVAANQAAAELPKIPHYNWSPIGVVEIPNSYSGGSLSGYVYYDVIGGLY